jgi:hypothetical protein
MRVLTAAMICLALLPSSGWAQETVATKTDNASQPSQAAANCKAMEKLVLAHDQQMANAAVAESKQLEADIAKGKEPHVTAESPAMKLRIPYPEPFSNGMSIIGMLCYALEQVRLQEADPLHADADVVSKCSSFYFVSTSAIGDPGRAKLTMFCPR